VTNAPEMIYLCTTDDIAGPGEDVEKQTNLVAKILERLHYVLASDSDHYHLWAMVAPNGPLPPEPEDGAEPIYLCTIDELAGVGAGDDVALKRMRLLGSIMVKLGWTLASGVEPRFHELWALPPERPESRDWNASDFERRFLGWLYALWGITPRAGDGDDAGYWLFDYQGATVRAAVIKAEEYKWLLLIEEPAPAPFSDIAAHHFRRAGRLRGTRADGTPTMQLRSTDLRVDFDDEISRA